MIHYGKPFLRSNVAKFDRFENILESRETKQRRVALSRTEYGQQLGSREQFFQHIHFYGHDHVQHAPLIGRRQ